MNVRDILKELPLEIPMPTIYKTSVFYHLSWMTNKGAIDYYSDSEFYYIFMEGKHNNYGLVDDIIDALVELYNI